MLADQGRLPPFYYVVLVVTTGLALALVRPYHGVVAFSLLLVVSTSRRSAWLRWAMAILRPRLPPASC